MVIRYKNMLSGETEVAHDRTSFWLCLLFGPLYFAVKGNFGHALISFVLGVMTSGVSFFIYPFFVRQINIRQYRSKGWTRAT